MNINKADAKHIVTVINGLFHFQKTDDWEAKSEKIVATLLELKFVEGKLDALRSFQGNLEDEQSENQLFERIDKLERREFLLLQTIETL